MQQDTVKPLHDNVCAVCLFWLLLFGAGSVNAVPRWLFLLHGVIMCTWFGKLKWWWWYWWKP